MTLHVPLTTALPTHWHCRWTRGTSAHPPYRIGWRNLKRLIDPAEDKSVVHHEVTERGSPLKDLRVLTHLRTHLAFQIPQTGCKTSGIQHGRHRHLRQVLRLHQKHEAAEQRWWVAPFHPAAHLWCCPLPRTSSDTHQRSTWNQCFYLFFLRPLDAAERVIDVAFWPVQEKRPVVLIVESEEGCCLRSEPALVHIMIHCSHGPALAMCGSVLSCVWLFVTLWTVARQAALSMRFPRQEYWSGLPFLPPRYLPDPGIKLASLASSALVGGFFTLALPRNPTVRLSPVHNPALFTEVLIRIAHCSCCLVPERLLRGLTRGHGGTELSPLWWPLKAEPDPLHTRSASTNPTASAENAGNLFSKPGSFPFCFVAAIPWTVTHQTPLSMGILQARILEWVTMPSSRGSSQPRDRTQVSHIAGRLCTVRAASHQGRAPPPLAP